LLRTANLIEKQHITVTFDNSAANVLIDAHRIILRLWDMAGSLTSFENVWNIRPIVLAGLKVDLRDETQIAGSRRAMRA
jgi:hypothetical protein